MAPHVQPVYYVNCDMAVKVGVYIFYNQASLYDSRSRLVLPITQIVQRVYEAQYDELVDRSSYFFFSRCNRRTLWLSPDRNWFANGYQIYTKTVTSNALKPETRLRNIRTYV
jgi:hypothetical protein